MSSKGDPLRPLPSLGGPLPDELERESLPAFPAGWRVALRGEEGEEQLCYQEAVLASVLSRHVVPPPAAAAAGLLGLVPGDGTGAELFSVDITKVLM